MLRRRISSILICVGLFVLVLSLVFVRLNSERFSEPKIFEDNIGSVNELGGLYLELERYDPVELARFHYKRKDYRILAIDGVVPIIPGLNNQDVNNAKLRFIVGGGDNISHEQAAWKKDVKCFAKSYNQEKIGLLKKRMNN